MVMDLCMDKKPMRWKNRCMTHVLPSPTEKLKGTRRKETPLTTEFEKDSVNLSGGESQKVAIARALIPEKMILSLWMEPSSALDPMAEYQLNKGAA